MKLKLDNAKKTLTISQQALLKASADDMALVEKYKAVGYSIVVAEPKRVKGDKTTDAEIRSALKGDKEALDTYLNLKKSSFFKAKKWFKENYK